MTTLELGRLLETLVEIWRQEGAQAVVLVGSRARGTASGDSDIDVAVVGNGPHHRLEVHDGTLVSVGWASADEQRARLYEPKYLATHVAGWRDANVLYDPDSVAASIAAEARAWTWDLVADKCDVWVADTVTSYAEEVQKLVAALGRGHDVLAGAERAILVIHLALPIALRHRILCASENELWDRVAAEIGDAWRDAQNAALGVNGEDLRSSCRGAVRLFGLAVSDVAQLLAEDQRAVVDLALSAAQPILRESV